MKVLRLDFATQHAFACRKKDMLKCSKKYFCLAFIMLTWKKYMEHKDVSAKHKTSSPQKTL